MHDWLINQIIVQGMSDGKAFLPVRLGVIQSILRGQVVGSLVN